MPLRSPNWYELNSTRDYPIDDSASGIDDVGGHMPTDILVDLCLRYDAPTPGRAMIAGITCTERLATVVITYAPTGPVGAGAGAAPPFQLLGSVSISQPIDPGRCYPIEPADSGVAGWIVFGRGALNPGRWRFSTPAQSGITPRCARSIPRPGVLSLGSEGGIGLTGLVKLEAGNDLESSVEGVLVDGKPTQAAVLRLAEGRDIDLLRSYAGTCGGRPEEGTCREPAVESINGVVPDCFGILTLHIHGAYASELPLGGGFAIDYPIDMATACAQQPGATWENTDACGDPDISSEFLGTWYTESSYAEFRDWYSGCLPYIPDLGAGVPRPLHVDVGRLHYQSSPATPVAGLGTVDGWLDALDDSRRLSCWFDVVCDDGEGNFLPAQVANSRVIAEFGALGSDSGFSNAGVILDHHAAPGWSPPGLNISQSQALRRYLLVLANFRDASFDLWWFDGVQFRRLTDPNMVGLCPLSMSRAYRITADLTLPSPDGPATISAQLHDMAAGGVLKASFDIQTTKMSLLLYPPEAGYVPSFHGLGTIRSRARFYRFSWEAI